MIISVMDRTVKSKLDLSSIRVKLVSSAGFVTFEGAPDPNGYYIVPVDAHVGAQKLVVQAPEGWTFGAFFEFFQKFDSFSTFSVIASFDRPSLPSR